MEKNEDQSTLCMACLCVGRSPKELTDERLKQYYLDMLKEIPLYDKPVNSPLICWECVALLRKVLSFREQVKDSYRILQTYSHENLYECLLNDVSRPPKLRVHVNNPVVILPSVTSRALVKEELKVEWGSDDDSNAANQCSRVHVDQEADDRIEILLKVEEKGEKCKRRKQPNVCNVNGSNNQHNLLVDKVSEGNDRVTSSLEAKDFKRETQNLDLDDLETDDRVSHTPDASETETEDVRKVGVLKVTAARSKRRKTLKVAKRLENGKKLNVCNGNDNQTRLPADLGVPGTEDPVTSSEPKGFKKEKQNTGLEDLETKDCISHMPDVSETEAEDVRNEGVQKVAAVKSKRRKALKVVKRLENGKKVRKSLKESSNNKIIPVELSYEEMLAEREVEAKREGYITAAYKCQTCLIGFNYHKSYKAHVAAKHSQDIGDYSCPICKTVIPSVESFTAHYKRHMRRYECSICRKRTADVKGMRQHLHSAHELPLREYRCDLCGLVSTSIDTHRYHKDTHKARVACGDCDKTFSHRAGLMNHRLAVHELKNVFPCTKCTKVFRWRTSLKRHLAKHNIKASAAGAGGAAAGPYCVACDIGFSSQCSLQRHLRNSLKHVTHDQLKFTCDHCERRFADKTKLRDHIEEKHLHRTYQCHVCQKTSKNRVGLDQHVRNVHKGRPNNKMCHHCGKGFPTKVQLESHIRTHTGERPFICEYCPTTFSQQSNLYKHHRHVHLNMKSKRYPLCKKRKPDLRSAEEATCPGFAPVVSYANMADNMFQLRLD